MAFGKLLSSILTAGGKGSAIPAAYIGGDILYEHAGHPLWKSVTGSGEREMEEWMREQGEYERKQRMKRRAQEREDQRTLERMAHVTSQLAAVNPQAFNETLAGRRLPQGAVVLGGQPRVDLLQELAYNLATKTPGQGEDRFNF